MTLVRDGVDLAKNVFRIHGVDRSEKAKSEWLAVEPDRLFFGDTLI